MKKRMYWKPRAWWKALLNRSMPVAMDVNGAILVALGVGYIYTPAGIILGGIASIVLADRFYGDK